MNNFIAFIVRGLHYTKKMLFPGLCIIEHVMQHERIVFTRISMAIYHNLGNEAVVT